MLASIFSACEQWWALYRPQALHSLEHGIARFHDKDIQL
jgi:hypothetical protein